MDAAISAQNARAFSDRLMRATPRQVLTIAGSDSGCGAGIQADIQTIHAHGGYAVSVITSVTAQNTQGIRAAYDLPLRVIEAQMEAVFLDFDIRAVKTGMLASRSIVRRVVLLFRRWKMPPLVVDPVMSAKDGCALLKPEAISWLKSDLLPLATLVTPNVQEAEILSETRIDSRADMEAAARKIHALGCTAVLIKGGHSEVAPACDLFFDGATALWLEGGWVTSTCGLPPHGTGCVHSAAIAVRLAQGAPLLEAVRDAKIYITETLRRAVSVGKGHPSLGIFPVGIAPIH